MLLNVAFSELKMKKGKVVLTNRGSIELHEDANALFVCKQFNAEHQSQAKLILFSLEAE